MKFDIDIKNVNDVNRKILEIKTYHKLHSLIDTMKEHGIETNVELFNDLFTTLLISEGGIK